MLPFGIYRERTLAIYKKKERFFPVKYEESQTEITPSLRFSHPPREAAHEA